MKWASPAQLSTMPLAFRSANRIATRPRSVASPPLLSSPSPLRSWCRCGSTFVGSRLSAPGGSDDGCDGLDVGCEGLDGLRIRFSEWSSSADLPDRHGDPF